MNGNMLPKRSDKWIRSAAAVHGLEEGAWVGYSASQFFYEYEMIKRLMGQHLVTMHELAERMKKEIDEWQGVASAMGEFGPRLRV
ncbi:MAG: hypothetical protein JW748_04725 [Anaerolineales bacterium]|nr:hypothetical protein [Anaerolineales bacterium]